MLKIALLSAFLISYFLHLTSRLPVLGAARADVLLGGAVLISVFLSPLRDKWRSSVPTAMRLYTFLIYIFLSLPLVTWPGSVIRMTLLDWIKVILFYIFIITAVRTEKQLKWIVLVFIGCQAFRILEPLYLHVTTGYWGDIAYSHVGGSMTGLDRLSGAPHDVVNPNQLAWLIVTVLPFLFFQLWQSNTLGKIAFLTLSLPFTYCLLLTGSRSGLICLTVTIVAIIMLSKRKKRNFTIAMLFILPTAIYFSGLLDGDMQTRYLSLFRTDVAGADTAKGRLEAMLPQIVSISNNPLFGNGLGTSRETNWNVIGHSSQITHNLYIEILQELGMVGFAIFAVYVISIMSSLKEAKLILQQSGRGGKDWLYCLASATQIWVIMDLFYSFSCFGLRSWEWYFFGGVATLCLVFAREWRDALDGDSVSAPANKPVHGFR